MKRQEKAGVQTQLAHCGRSPRTHAGTVNTPIYRASTILFPNLAALQAKEQAKLRYGRRGTPTTHALEEAIVMLEGSDQALITPSGVSAISTVLMSYAEPGAHFLIADSAYGPTRKFCDFISQKIGVKITYYDPTMGGDIQSLIRPQTRLIWLESPGSQTFEIQDVSAIAHVARHHHIPTAMDNSWSGGYFCQPLSQGVDISVQSATKYISGHSDFMMGTIACQAHEYERLRETYLRFGLCVGADDAFLALRGLRTLAVRMRQHYASGLEVAHWLQSQEEVVRIMHPALPEDPGHALWREHFTGASGLFGFVMKSADSHALARMFDGFSLFGMGSSWGGFESLIVPSNPAQYRSATKWQSDGQTVRIHIGLEDPADLIKELRQGFDRLIK